MLKRQILDGTPVVVLESGNARVAMSEGSLEKHLGKHPDVANTPEGYLEQAMKVLTGGKRYKDGVRLGGLFARAYDSRELGCPIICTVHRLFTKDAPAQDSDYQGEGQPELSGLAYQG